MQNIGYISQSQSSEMTKNRISYNVYCLYRMNMPGIKPIIIGFDCFVRFQVGWRLPAGTPVLRNGQWEVMLSGTEVQMRLQQKMVSMRGPETVILLSTFRMCHLHFMCHMYCIWHLCATYFTFFLCSKCSNSHMWHVPLGIPHVAHVLCSI